jgi:hypothetical protein
VLALLVQLALQLQPLLVQLQPLLVQLQLQQLVRLLLLAFHQQMRLR